MEHFNFDELSEIIYSAVCSDICDQMEMRNQTFDPGIFQTAGSKKVLIGRARTAVSTPVDEIPLKPYNGEINFLDSLQIGDVAVVDCSQRPAAAWGELFSTAAFVRGARGAIIDGLIRDKNKIDTLATFPVFAKGTRPTDSLGRVGISQYDKSIEIMGCTVESGDVIIADEDGVCVIPKSVADEVITRAKEKASLENSARKMLLAGGYMRDVWNEYRVL